MGTKYYLEIDASGFEAPCDEGGWLSYGLIVTEGSTLQECLDNAQVDLIDQDGGEYAVREADSAGMQDAIEKEFMAKYQPEPSDSQLADREYRAEKDEEVKGYNR